MLYPMFLMMLLTFVVGICAVKTRFSHVKNGNVSIKHFQLMRDQDIPEAITKTTRNFNNQFEIPVLFYVVCTLYISLGIESYFAIGCAWLFVCLRIVHSYINLTYNNIIHRMLVFWSGFICIMVLWILLLLNQT